MINEEKNQETNQWKTGKSEQETSNQGNRVKKSLNNNNSETKEKGKKLKTLENEEDIDPCEQGLDIKKLLKIKGKKKRKLYGKRVDSTTQKGKYVKSRLSKDLKNDIAIDATLRAAAISSEGTINVKSEDLDIKLENMVQKLQ